ncbi:MAG TPA: BMC domain-containing protein [Clostridiales bacterium]|nr:BMC domain-containing protein [Clostridiales bacterium]
MIIRIINSPTDGTLEVIKARVRNNKIKAVLKERNINAVGLVQGQLADIIVACDTAEKASNVFVSEITGVCPQHMMLIGIFGDTAAVETAVRAIEARLKEK